MVGTKDRMVLAEVRTTIIRTMGGRRKSESYSVVWHIRTTVFVHGFFWEAEDEGRGGAGGVGGE